MDVSSHQLEFWNLKIPTDAKCLKRDMFRAQLTCQQQLHVRQHTCHEGTLLSFWEDESYIYIYVCVACRHVTVDSLPGISSPPSSSNARCAGQVLTGVHKGN